MKRIAVVTVSIIKYSLYLRHSPLPSVDGLIEWRKRGEMVHDKGKS